MYELIGIVTGVLLTAAAMAVHLELLRRRAIKSAYKDERKPPVLP
jgi:hypothetical protein